MPPSVGDGSWVGWAASSVMPQSGRKRGLGVRG